MSPAATRAAHLVAEQSRVPDRDLATSRLAWWCWSALGATGIVVLYRVCVLTGLGQYADDRLMLRVAVQLSHWTWMAERLLQQITVIHCVCIAAVIALMATAAGRGRHAVASAGCAAVVAMSAELLKVVLVRPDLLGSGATNSFPSGHVAAVAALVAAAVVATPPRGRRWTLLAGIPLLVATGLAVVVVEWHRPSDALAAALLGLSACGATIAGCDRAPEPPERWRPSGRTHSRV